jgi:hypothetical protein
MGNKDWTFFVGQVKAFFGIPCSFTSEEQRNPRRARLKEKFTEEADC